MPLDAAGIWLNINGEKLCSRLGSGKYHFMPASGFTMAKSDGQYRRLARLTAIDSIIQTVITESKLKKLCERLKNVIDAEEDSVVIYRGAAASSFEKMGLGQTNRNGDMIL